MRLPVSAIQHVSHSADGIERVVLAQDARLRPAAMVNTQADKSLTLESIVKADTERVGNVMVIVSRHRCGGADYQAFRLADAVGVG